MQYISSLLILSISIVISLHICLLPVVTTESPKPRLLITRLIHSDSIYSPSYNHKEKLEDLVPTDSKNVLLSDSCLNENYYVPSVDVEAPLTPEKESRFLALLEVGEKRRPQLVIMDTGSSLSWINCEPCYLNIPEPIFDPAWSSTYKAINCTDDENCSAYGFYFGGCDKKRRCKFLVTYGDSNLATGHLAREEFKFGASDEILRGIIFGCARKSTLKTNGLLGLGMGKSSLIAQTSSTIFSHCFGNISDISYKYNTLIIGDQISLMGYQTPMIIEGKYFIILEGIAVGNTQLKIDPKNFIRNPDYTGGMIVDTGSTYTFLPKVVVEMIETEIIDLIEFSLTRNHLIVEHKYNMLCYNGILTRDLKGFPTVSFTFKDDVTMEFGVENIFHQKTDRTFCLGIIPSENLHLESSILGNRMMQYFYIVYDLTAKKLSLTAMECSVLGDYIGVELL